MGNDEINDDGDDIVDGEVKCCKYFWENYKLTNLWALFYGFSHKNRLKWEEWEKETANDDDEGGGDEGDDDGGDNDNDTTE